MKKNYTTVNITKPYQELLRKLSSTAKMSQVEYLEKCLFWFKQTGMDPGIIEPFSPKQAIEKLTKRVDTSISFFKKHETEKLAPLFQDLSILNYKLSKNLEYMISSEELFEFKEFLNQNKSLLNGISQANSVKTPKTENLRVNSNENFDKLVRLLRQLFYAIIIQSKDANAFKDIAKHFENIAKS